MAITRSQAKSLKTNQDRTFANLESANENISSDYSGDANHRSGSGGLSPEEVRNAASPKPIEGMESPDVTASEKQDIKEAQMNDSELQVYCSYIVSGCLPADQALVTRVVATSSQCAVIDGLLYHLLATG